MLNDLARIHPGLIKRVEHTADPQLPITLWDRGGQGTAIQAPERRDGLGQIPWLASQVQDGVIELLWSEGAPPTWPECRRHPDGHPLEPAIRGAAVWVCPADLAVIAEIGTLGVE